MIVPYPPGGSTDVIARIMVERMPVPLGQRIIVENVGGADGSSSFRAGWVTRAVASLQRRGEIFQIWVAVLLPREEDR